MTRRAQEEGPVPPPAEAAGGHDRWRRAVYEPFVAAHPERRSPFTTPSGLTLPPVYEDAPGSAGPGEFPYTRGIHPTMYRGRLWTMRQYAGYSSPRETNARFRYLLAEGQTGLSVAFDLPTQIGYDSDDPKARGEVGRVGVPISTVAHLEELLDGIPLDRVSISMTINATAPVLLGLLLVAARRRGIPWSTLRGTIQNDILKEFIARGTQRYPVAPSLRLAVDLIEFAAAEVPQFHPISISGYHIREAGATAVEEVAFTLANGCAYLDQCRARGLDLERIGRRLSFFFNAHNHLFEETAKFRAARAMWAETCRERYGLRSTEACQLRFHTQTAGSTLTAQEPENNVARVTIQALAAVLGGTQSLHTNGQDEALSLPSERSAKVALRTQQILAEESGVTEVVDPLGGCPYIEDLTRRIALGARELIHRIAEQGGMVAAIENGFVRRAIEASAYRAQMELERGSRRQVGVTPGGEIPHAPFRVDPAVEAERRAALAALRARRAPRPVADALERLAGATRAGENLLPPIIAALEVDATLGEISASLARELGEYRDV